MFDIYGGQTYTPVGQQKGNYTGDPYSAMGKTNVSGMDPQANWQFSNGAPKPGLLNSNPYDSNGKPYGVDQSFLYNGPYVDPSYKPFTLDNSMVGDIMKRQNYGPNFFPAFDPNKTGFTNVYNSYQTAMQQARGYNNQHPFNDPTDVYARNASTMPGSIQKSYEQVYNQYAQTGAFGTGTNPYMQRG